MTVYAIHRYSKNTSTTGALEAFPSVERASVALQLRARKQESGTYYTDAAPTAPAPGPRAAFPEADLTGYLLVWRRRAGEEQPGDGETPEELWRLSPLGAVIKEDYSAGGQAYTLPQLTPEQRRAKALRVLRGVPAVTAEFRAAVNPAWEEVVRELVQDEVVEDAVLRVMQAVWEDTPHPSVT